jgi:hypothetical protein
VHRSSDDGFFSFLIGDTLNEVGNIVVTVPGGSWPLSNSLLFRLETKGLVQIVVELDSQELLELPEERNALITGDYDDLINWRIEPIIIPDVTLPDKVMSLVEFQSSSGKVVGAEIQLTRAMFSVLLYPEDIEMRSAGAVWEFVRNHGLYEMRRLTVLGIGDLSAANLGD